MQSSTAVLDDTACNPDAVVFLRRAAYHRPLHHRTDQNVDNTGLEAEEQSPCGET